MADTIVLDGTLLVLPVPAVQVQPLLDDPTAPIPFVVLKGPQGDPGQDGAADLPPLIDCGGPS